jgi:cell division protein FtsB
MSQHPQRRPGSSSRGSRAPRASAAGDGVTGSARPTRRARAGSSRPVAARPATAPAASATGVARRAGRKAKSPEAPTRSLLPQSALARQVALLGLVLFAVALSVAFPLRNYLEQRTELAQAVSAQQELEQQRDELQARKLALTDADYVAAEARRRLQYVTPGDTVFVVHAPALADPTETATADTNADQPWYGNLWTTLSEDGAS